MSGIIKRVKDPILKILKDLVFSEEEMREKVTYRKYLKMDTDPVSKRPVTVYEDFNVDAVRMRHTQDTVKLSTTAVEIGQPFFLFIAETLPSSRTLSKKDIIIDSFGDTLKVVDIIGVYSIITGVTVAA